MKDKGCSKVERRYDKGRANDEWLYSGFTVGLQWVYSGSTMNDERRKSESKWVLNTVLLVSF